MLTFLLHFCHKKVFQPPVFMGENFSNTQDRLQFEFLLPYLHFFVFFPVIVSNKRGRKR